MHITTVKVVYFSPTQTTKAVVRAIAHGMSATVTEYIDITLPQGREARLQTSAEDLLIIGGPVYSGRMPALFADWLKTLQAEGTPVVCVATYGNRAFEDAVLELKNLALAAGGVPVAGAAFIGEHSFSSAERPTAPGRPDAEDLRQAEAFGRDVWEKVSALPSLSPDQAVEVPGVFPYRKEPGGKHLDFIAVDDNCTQCGLCAEICPVRAIDPEDSGAIDTQKCFACCACIKICPEGARSIKPGPIQDAAQWLKENCAQAQKPQYFL